MMVPLGTASVRAARNVAFVLAVAHCIGPIEAADNFCTPANLGRFGEWPKALDSSIYWFGHDDQTEKATSGSPSKFYDPSKPTMLYFHGWTGAGNGWTSLCKRITTRCHPDICPDGGGQLLVNDWLDAGWNVGLFYWDQFADEECARDAEQKIWFDRKGDGFRWKSYDVGSGIATYHTYEDYEDLGDASVADMCVRHVKMAMGSFTGPQVRFVGHSLGSQLAVRCAALLHVEGHRAAPQRLALLEPYFSKHSHMVFFGCHAKVTTGKGMDDFAAQSTVSYVKNLWDRKQVVTEVYKSSILTEKSSDSDFSAYSELKNMVKHGAASSMEDSLVGNLGGGMREKALEKSATVVEYQPDWCSGVASDNLGDVQHMGCRHCAVMPMYLLSFGRAAPPLSPPPTLNVAQPGSALSSCMTPSASCTDGQVREWVQRQLDMVPDQSWSQLGGRTTFDASDDTFTVNPSMEQGYQLGLESANAIVEQTAKELPPTNKEPEWLLVITSPMLLVPVAAACIFGVAAVAFFTLRRVGDSSEDSEEEELTASRSFMSDKGIAPVGYEGLIPANIHDRSTSSSFTGAALLGPDPVRPGYGHYL